MRDEKVLTLKEALVGLNALMEEAEKQPGRPMCMGVADQHGIMICYYRMDGAGDWLREMIWRKAYTAAQFGETTKALREAMRSEGMTIGGDFQHTQSTTVPGGVPIIPSGTEREEIGGYFKGETEHLEKGVTMERGQIGACAAGGRWADEDEMIAKVGAMAIQKLIWGGGK